MYIIESIVRSLRWDVIPGDIPPWFTAYRVNPDKEKILMNNETEVIFLSELKEQEMYFVVLKVLKRVNDGTKS